jgi:3-hydroxyisobutyrate dehydrogenase
MPPFFMATRARVRVGFLGLGHMGSAMAARLVANAEFEVAVWNRTPSRVRSLRKLGAIAAGTPHDAAVGAKFVITMLSDGDAIRDILDGDDGLIEGLEEGATWIEMSTIGRDAAIAIKARVEAAGAVFLDAPVSGSLGPATRGELVAMVGGSEKQIANAEPVLNALCKRIIFAGAVGQGQALKVILNGVGAHHVVAFTSMLALGERAGLARKVIVDAFTSGAFASPSYVSKRAKVLARDYSPEFSLDLTLKDVKLNLELQRATATPLPVVQLITSIIEEAIAAGLGPEDLYSLEKVFAKK